MTSLRPTVFIGDARGMRAYANGGPAVESQQPMGVAHPYGCRRHLRISQRRRRIEAAKWALFVLAMVIALGPAAVAVWAWGQYFGAW
jgi:hypothetical protein